jgi:hypothetical protein
MRQAVRRGPSPPTSLAAGTLSARANLKMAPRVAKSGETRRVDMSLELTRVFKDLQVERHLEAAANGWNDLPPWAFCDQEGRMLHHNALRITFHELLRGAGLRQVRFHDLRHTFASLLLQQGESPVYVKEQMGHRSIQITVDQYGHLIPGGNKQAVDRLDWPVNNSASKGQSATPAQPASRPIAVTAAEGMEPARESRTGFGVSDGFRTRNLLGHSQAL